MSAPEFDNFRLVGGTALSLQIGHRLSIDIDLFSDTQYGNIDFRAIDLFIERNFTYADHFVDLTPAIGKSYAIGTDKDNAVKLDIYYTDPFIQAAHVEEGIRLATIEEIIAMKIDIVQRGGRKKDFWDLHELLATYSIPMMLELHKLRYQYNHDAKVILRNFIDFSSADDDFDPICLQGKHWEFIKEDIEEAVSNLS
ncbi:MAG: nucleotidyl transferase AbiEii/AbiGii toxin family protein [Chitinophagaceae bacterium]